MPAQSFELRLDLRDDVIDPLEIGFSGAQPQFSFVPTRMKARNTGGFFKERAPCRRAGRDQFPDLALPDHGWRMRASRGIGKQQLHVTRPYFSAIDAINRSRLALDPAGDFKHIGRVERGRSGAIGIVEHQGDFSGIARRPIARA